MSNANRHFIEIGLRYFIMTLSSISGLAFFYFVFTIPTIYVSYFFISLFFQVSLSGNSIIFGNDFLISIIPACVAGAAYYLLFILNLSVPGINLSKRISMVLVAFLSFFVINTLRIVLLSALYFNSFPFLETLHKFLWYFGSVVITAGIWFFEVYFFKIKEYPFYSDLKFIYSKSIFVKK